jgi:hypothetical protein
MTAPRTVLLALVLAACGGSPTPAPPPPVADPIAEVARLLGGLAHDSLEGRRTGQPGAWRAARFIAGEMRRLGLQPGGDSGFIQRVPLGTRVAANGTQRPVLLPAWSDWDTVPAERRQWGGNVVGVIPGSDPQLRDEYILLTAHYDHIGIGMPVAGDSINNGADDDASGVVAILEMARLLRSGPPPLRTVVVAAMTGEEVGLLGTRWFVQHPWRPLSQMAGNLEVEMIGRPDSLAGGFGKTWLTGYERSTLGEMLASGGIPIVPDPRPAQNFFMRSDNIAFAYEGIPAHTLSTFNLHADYHRPSDEIDKMDLAHMVEVIRAAERAARIMTDGPRPAWKEGGRPVRPTPRP